MKISVDDSVESSSFAGSMCRAPGSEVRVWIDEKVFSVDKELLEKNCEYFQALFRSGMKECQQNEIYLQVVSARGFITALQVIHGEKPFLSDDEIVEAVECAAFLQVPALVKHLINIINSENCIIIYQSAATFGLWMLLRSSGLFIRDMYHDLKEGVYCLPKDLIDYVESLIPSTYITVGSHSPSIKLLKDFMRTVCYLDEDEKDWKVLTHLPLEASTTMAGVTVLDNKIFIVGGVCDMTNKVVDSGYCYDVSSDTWKTFSNPQQLRYNCTLVEHEGSLYAIGGEFNRTSMSSVEKYDITTDVWSFVAHLPKPAATVPCARTMGRMFICLWKPKDATEIYEYFTDTDEWKLVTTLIRHQSYGHRMVAHRDKLYVMRNGPCDDFLKCVIDSYNLISGQWTSMSGQYENSEGALFTAVVRGDSVLTMNRRATVEYAIEENKWRTKTQMSGFPRFGSMWTFLLRLPQKSKQPVGTADLSRVQQFEPSSRIQKSSVVKCYD